MRSACVSLGFFFVGPNSLSSSNFLDHTVLSRIFFPSDSNYHRLGCAGLWRIEAEPEGWACDFSSTGASFCLKLEANPTSSLVGTITFFFFFKSLPKTFVCLGLFGLITADASPSCYWAALFCSNADLKSVAFPYFWSSIVVEMNQVLSAIKCFWSTVLPSLLLLETGS